jgi:hypothetical protein
MRRRVALVWLLLGAGVATGQAQGTIQFLNSALSRLLFQEIPCGPITTAVPVGTHVGAFWGTAAGGAAAIAGHGHGTIAGPTSLTAAGGLWPAAGAPGGPVYPVAGSVEGQRVWLKIAAWVGGDAQSPTGSIIAYGESEVVSVVLGPTAGPGTVVWQSSSGTSPVRAKPFVIGVDSCIPEPSVLSISALGLGVFLLCRRKSKSEC